MSRTLSRWEAQVYFSSQSHGAGQAKRTALLFYLRHNCSLPVYLSKYFIIKMSVWLICCYSKYRYIKFIKCYCMLEKGKYKLFENSSLLYICISPSICTGKYQQHFVAKYSKEFPKLFWHISGTPRGDIMKGDLLMSAQGHLIHTIASIPCSVWPPEALLMYGVTSKVFEAIWYHAVLINVPKGG